MFDILLSGQLFVAAIATGVLFALVALGLNLVYGTMRLLNVAHGELIMVGAYVAFLGFTTIGLSPLVGAVLAGLLTGALGAALHVSLLRQLFNTRDTARIEPNSLLVFVGISVILQNVTALTFTGTPQGYHYLDQVFQFGDVSLTANRLATSLIAAAICVGVLLFLRLSITGLAIKALIQNREAAGIVGINVGRVQFGSLCLGFGVAGLAGALVSMTEQISPFMGFPFTIASFVVVILGGLGNLAGGIAAGLVLGFLQTYGVALTSSSWASILLYGVFVAVLLLRPEGMLSKGYSH
jgi:branched-chain amino acid transport system permease protein